jgi:hypothetical protein
VATCTGFARPSPDLAVCVGDVAADHGYWPAGGVDPADVAGHERRNANNSTASDWGADCSTRAASSSGAKGLDVYGHVLEADYRLAVVLAQNEGVPVDGPNGVTLFRDAKAGQFVWADVDGDGKFAGRHEADAGKLVLCGGSTVPQTDTVNEDRPSRASNLLGGWTLAIGFTALVGIMFGLFGAREGRGRSSAKPSGR